MTKLRGLIEFLPKGNWKIIDEVDTDPNRLIGPEDSVIITVESNELVSEKITFQFLFELLNSIPDILDDLDSERLKTAGLFKELNRVKEARKQSYEKGVSDSYRRLTDVEVRTPTARDALLEASGRVLDLLEDE